MFGFRSREEKIRRLAESLEGLKVHPPLVDNLLTSHKRAITKLAEFGAVNELTELSSNASPAVAEYVVSELERTKSVLYLDFLRLHASDEVAKRAESILDKMMFDFIENKSVPKPESPGGYISPEVAKLPESELKKIKAAKQLYYLVKDVQICHTKVPKDALMWLRYLGRCASPEVAKEAIFSLNFLVVGDHNYFREFAEQAVSALEDLKSVSELKSIGLRQYNGESEYKLARQAIGALEKMLPEFIEKKDADGLEYLAGHSFSEVIKKQAESALERIKSNAQAPHSPATNMSNTEINV